MFVFWVRDRMFGEYSRGGFVCAYAKSCVLPHLRANEGFCARVCFRPSCQTAAIFVSQTGREAGEARRSFEVLFSPPKSSIRPEEICHVVPPFWFPYGGGWGEGYLFLFAVDISIHTHTHTCNRQVKVRNLFGLAVESFFSISLPGLGQKWAKQLF